MVDIKLHRPIDREDVNEWFAMWGMENQVFSLESWQRILEEYPDEKDFRFNIHCDGGNVHEGLAIYDAIRTSGKNIYCNVEGNCHSMAIVLLLAAPFENRSANPNCRALIHKVYVDYVPDTTADGLREMADFIEKEQSACLDIYADRTGQDRVVLENLMKEEKFRTADELLQYGFISKVNTYNTNQHKKSTQNNKSMEAKNLLQEMQSKISNFLKRGEAKNFDHVDSDGTILFSTEVEDDTLEVGMAATPDGTFTLPDGRVVVIEGGVITRIDEATQEPSNEDDDPEALKARIAELEKENEDLKKENEDLKKQVEEVSTENKAAKNLLHEAEATIRSSYKPAGRQASNKQKPQTPSFKDEVREKLHNN